VNELGVHVRVVNGALLVTGDVPTEERRQAIGDVVAELAPGAEVRNNVSVTDLSAPVDQEVVS
jgi:osmotically-inducible protein OsmY